MKKNQQIILLNVLATILVVFGHSDITPDFKDLFIFKWIYSFHMPLFFFISGFLFCLTNGIQKISFISFYKFSLKKIKRLIIPYLFITTLIFIIKAKFITDESLMQHPISFSLTSYFDSLFIHPLGFLWFLPTLFCIFLIIFPIWKFICIRFKNSIFKKSSILILIAICFQLLSKFLPDIPLLEFSASLHYSIYFIFGIVYCEFKNILDLFLKKYFFIVITATFVISLWYDLNIYVNAFNGILLFITIALMMGNKVPKFIENLSLLTYSIYLLSYFPQMFIRGPIAHNFSEINQYFLSGFSFICGLFIPILIILSLKKIKELYPKLNNLNKIDILLGI